MGRLFLAAGQTFDTIGGISSTDVVGTTANETVFVAANGKAVFDASFNRGGDTIDLAGLASSYKAKVVGSTVLITSTAGASITVPIGREGLTLRFDDTSAVLKLDNGVVKIGATTIAATEVPVVPPVAGAVVPVVVLAGQSNAVIPPVGVELISRLTQTGGAFEWVSRAEGGTSLFANGANDWDPTSTGELADQLIDQVKAAMANAVAQGQVPQVTMLWIQGEADAGRTSADYLAKLTAFFADFRQGIGQPDARIVISPLPVSGNVRTAQFQAADTLANVDILETRGLKTFDGVHYTDEAGAWIAGQFIDIVAPVTPKIPDYQNLLPKASITVNGNTVTIASGVEDLLFTATDNRNYKITSRSGDDQLLLGSGHDNVNTASGRDIVDLGSGSDSADTGLGNDAVFGRDGADFIITRDGEDYASGGSGGDTLIMGGQNDIALGGEGTDGILGEGGADTLSGGPGADKFYYNAVSDSTVAAPDTIIDFEIGGDKIDLKAVMAGLNFVGTGAFTGTGQVRYQIAGSTTTVQVNTTGDLLPEMAINLIGQHSLTAGDFVFA